MRFAPLLLLNAALVLGACSSNSESTTDNTNSPSDLPLPSVSYAEDATDITPVLTGTTVPNPTVRTVKGDSFQLMDLVSQKPTALIFYRGG